MKKVKAIIEFTDLKESVVREIGDTFICDEERAKDLVEWEFVKVVEEISEKPKKAIKKER